MDLFERLEEKAGHAFTHIGGPVAGVSSYYCEKCGALLLLEGDDRITFHLPFGALASEARCVGLSPPAGHALRDKLASMRQRNLQMLLSAEED